MTAVSEQADDTRLTAPLIRLALAVVVGTFTVQMDATMVNVALNTLRSDFSASISTIQWVSTAYLLAMAVAIPTVGWAVDRFGSRGLWIGALTLFVIASAVSGFADSAGFLIACRVVQGLAGGILLPLSLVILAQAAGPTRLGRVMAIIGIPSLLGPVVGPIIGGAIVQSWGWNWIFLINVPIGIVALVASWRTMPAGIRRLGARFDLVGFLLLAPGLAALLYSLATAGNAGGFDHGSVLAPLAASAVLLIGFVVYALRTSREPLVDLRLFRSPQFAAATGIAFFVIMGLLGAMLLVPLYFQLGRGDSALTAGLVLAPQGLGAAMGIAASGRLIDRFSAVPLAIGGVVASVGGLLILTGITATTSIWTFAIAEFILGIGFGLSIVVATTVSYRGLESAAIPRATTALRIFQQVGSSLGVAILAIVLQNGLATAHGSADVASAFATALTWAMWATALSAIPAAVLVVATIRAKARNATATATA
jgi:EmrB/QacA subfamily drug resistance transporter